MTGASILVVEDDDDVLESIGEVLAGAGYRVTAAHNGVEALAALRRMPRPAALVIDFMMDEMTGPELLRTCAADPKLAGIPALVISGLHGAAVTLPEVHAFVPKPFDGEQLLAGLSHLLRRVPMLARV